jgi:hypothetical protein
VVNEAAARRRDEKGRNGRLAMPWHKTLELVRLDNDVKENLLAVECATPSRTVFMCCRYSKEARLLKSPNKKQVRIKHKDRCLKEEVRIDSTKYYEESNRIESIQ